MQRTPNCKLIVIDPLTSYLQEINGRSIANVLPLLDPLARFAEKFNVAVILVNHLNKRGGAAIHRSLGSISIIGLTRVAWGFVKCTDDPHRRLMVPLKNNLAADAEGLAFSITNSAITWEDEPVDVSADEAFLSTRRVARTGCSEQGGQIEKAMGDGETQC